MLSSLGNTLNTFCSDYLTARNRFRKAAIQQGCTLETYSIGQQTTEAEDLTIDVALWGSQDAQRIIILSSGLHGVEGFAGSAIQIAFMENYLSQLHQLSDTAFIFIHSLNPYGFAYLRRCNEDNVDLNRSFLLPGQHYQGSPKGYDKLDRILNPPTEPSRWELFFLKALGLIIRYGNTTLKNTIPLGQHDFPKGLFFGGHSASKTQEILQANLPRWIHNAQQILHLDFHTALGKKFGYLLLPTETTTLERYQWLAQKFDTHRLASWKPEGITYPIRGDMGRWCQVLFPQKTYDFLTVEFGTYPTMEVMKTLRAENCAYWWGKPETASYRWAKQRMMEIFAPSDERWRQGVITQGIQLVKQALDAIAHSNS